MQLDRAMAPLREEFANRVAFRAVDIDRAESVKVCKDCSVTTVPTLVFFSHGRLMTKYVGLRSIAALRQQIAELLGELPPAWPEGGIE
jgi:thioredoxin-like negative regulator of GroEL